MAVTIVKTLTSDLTGAEITKAVTIKLDLNGTVYTVDADESEEIVGQLKAAGRPSKRRGQKKKTA